ncbi:putative chaperone protein DNAj [Trypanosoma vivax]|uniref:Putative chaperone protein DNAj n=1 Tax=Trypanosoma vivax (strain Y486) TaxID=1055687 RepID=G0U9K4_TRYVY|nr:putative chaperone protein DNAj [Trypanosoma vivax]CCC54290.1 putative chaperone protein DNAj [Trypanosoma vivax Y486]
MTHVLTSEKSFTMHFISSFHAFPVPIGWFLFLCSAMLSTLVAGDDQRQEEMEEIDYYAVLGLNEDATAKDIRQKFRELSRKYHPDVARTAEAREMFTKISRANEVLSDKKKRRMYDMRGEEGLRQLQRAEASGNSGQSNSIFSQLFSMRNQQFKGQNSEATFRVPLETVYTGGRQVLSLNKQKVCTQCKGTGAEKNSGTVTCPRCRGHGVLIQRMQLGPGMYQEMRHTCPSCGGKGHVVKKQCSACHGRRVVRADVELVLDVEAGIPEGHTVTFEMEADESPDLIPGDFLLHVRTQPHDRFSRRENGVDLDTTLTVTLKEALLGFERSFPHLDGKEFTVRAEGVTPYGTVLKLSGKGMPRHHVPSERGDLYVKVLFDMPAFLTDSQRKELEEHL